MYKKFFPLFFALLVFTQVFAQDIEFKPLKKVFNKGEKVCFVLVNNSDTVIYLPNSAPWVVFEKEKPENIVYSPVALQVITTLKKGDKKQWCWEQKNFEGIQVPSGEYVIRITFFKGKQKVMKSFVIKINSTGSVEE